jgi:hypothetical protein
MNTRFLLPVALALLMPSVGVAQFKLNDQISLTGYVVGSYARIDRQPGDSHERTDTDAAKLLLAADYKPVGAVVSVWHHPQAPQKIALLDAYASFDLGRGSVIRAGKFLTYLGFESFDLTDLAQISYANGDFLLVIPGYHTGVKWDYTADTVGAGFAVVDSVYSGPYYLRGDGELNHNGGCEGYLTYKGIPKLTLWAGAGFDTKGNVVSKNDAIFVGDLWATYAAGANDTLAAEFAWKSGVLGDEGHNWLALYNHTITDAWSAALRVSGEQVSDGGPSFTKFTVSPTYKVNTHVQLRAEYSRYEYRHHPDAVTSANFYAVQAVVKF